MTERAFKIDKAVLTYLSEKDGSPILETIIHAAIQDAARKQGEVPPSIDEMDQSFIRLNAKKNVIGLPSAVRGVMKWTVTDAGRATLIQMQNE